MMKDMTIYRKFYMLSALLIGLILFPSMLQADPFPPDNDSNATGMHYEPVAWPTESEWKPYTRFNNSLEDPRTQDPSNGGTSPQNYVNIASSCLDETLPSIYYFLRQGATPEDDVIMFRWRVEQIANTYATGPSAGSAGATDPWGSALWTVFFDLDGDGYRDIAAHIDGSSGTPGEDIDRIFGIYGNVPTQSIAAEDDPNIHVIGHNPAGFVNSGSSTLYNYHNTNTPDTSWPNGSSETVWDYGTTRSTEVSTNPCNEYYIDYQIPVALLDASAFGGPTLTRDTPISMIFCTSNSLNNPLQKDCAINAAWTSDTEDPAPFGDYVSFDRNESYQQPIVDDLTGSGCNPVALTAKVKDSLAVVNGVVVRSVQSVDFYVYRDADGDGEANDGDTWTHAVSAVPVDFTTWVADWASEELFAGQYLIGVQVKDNRTLVDDNMPESNTTNVTFSYLTQAEVDALPGKPVDETWWANPEITGVKDIALAVNSCGVTPTLVKDVNDSNPTVGDTVTFGLTFTNPASADNLEVNLTQLQDILPTGFSYHGNLGGTLAASVTTTSNIGDQGTIIWNVNGGGITVPTDTNVTLTFEANVSDVTGVYNNVATSDSSFGVVRSNIVPINVGAPLLNIAIEANKVLYAEGETVNYTVTYGNDSSVSTTNTVVEVNLTALGFSSIGNISDGGVLSGEVITWTIGDLPTGSSGNIFTFDANVSDPFNTINNPIVAPATINSNETNLQTATATILVDVPTPSLVISKDANVSFVTPANNEQVEYNITIANTGTGAATDVNITDVVPTGFTFVSAPAVNPNPAGTLSGGTVTWAIGSLDVNSSTSVTLILQVDNPNTDTSSTNTAVAVASNMSGTREANVTIGIFNVIGGGTCNDLANLYDPSIYVDTSDNTLSTTAVATVDYDKNTATTFDIYLAPDLNDTTVYQGFSFANDLIGAGETFTTATLYFTSYSSKIDGSGQIDIYADGSLFTTQAITTSSTGNNVPSVLEVDLSGLTATQLNNLEFNATAFSSDKNKDFHTDYVKLCVLKETSPFLTLQYKVDKLNANVDDNLTYTVTYGNSGGADANGTTITASVPEGLESIVPANGGIYDAGTGLITWSDLNITSGLTDTLTFTADINNSFTGSTLPSTATLEHTPSTTSLSADVVTQLEGIVEGGTPDIRLELSADKTALIPGDIVTYSLKVINVGDGSALDLNISEAIPQLLDASSLTWFKYVTGSMTGGDTNLTESATLLEWGIDSLGVGQFETLTFKMEVNATGVPSGLTVIDDNATATASNVVGTAQSNVVTVTINTNPNLAITKSVSNPNAVPGEVVTYTINVKNIGTGDANGTTMSDPIPNNMSFEGNASTITTTQGTANFDGVRNEVIVTLGTLGAGEDANITFQAKVSALPAGSTTITNTAFTAASNAATRSDTADIISVADVNLTVDISGPTSGGYPSTTISQNSSSITIGVENTSSFIPGQVIKIDGTVYTIVTIGGNSLDLNDTVTVTEGTEVIGSVTYSVRYNNVGDADANDTNLSVDMGGLDFYSATGNSTFDGTSVKWDLNTSVVVGTTGTFKIVAFPPNVGSFTLDAEIVSDATADNLEDNNRDTITTIFGGITAVKTTSTPVVTQPSSGTVNVNYKIVITNSLNKIINDVNVTDTLPSGFTYLSTSTGQTVDASDTSRPIWSGIDVPAEGNATIEFIATINANTAATTHQNAIDTQTAEANTSIIQYDEISSTGEDVTVLASTDGVVTGYVFLDSNKDGNYTNTDRGFEGIAVTITSDTNASLFYTVSTNADGYFSRVVGEGNWTVSYTPITTLTTDYEFTIGSNPTSYEVLGGATVVDYNGYEEPTILSVTSDTVTEGQDLNHTVTIDGNVSVAKTYSFSLEDNTTTEGDDYSLASMTFTNGVTYDSGTGLITVPANVTSFNVIVPTIDDADPESTEWYDLTIGGVSATGTILDNDTAVGDIDYGDLPVSYGTLLANDAPRHTIGTGDIYLGSTLPDAESDGQPSDDAKADDNGSNPNEEDGIVFLNPMVEGEDSNLTVTASAQCDTSTCNFSMWIDFNQDGDFEDAGEQIFADSVIGAGDTNLTYSVPSGTDTSKPMYAMARLSTDAGLGTTGLATDGEVETYYIDSPSTLPITIAYVYPQLYGNSLDIEFSTATEVGNLGFNIYGIKGKRWIKLNEEIIEGAISSDTPIDYQTTLTLANELKITSIGIAGINLDGSEDRHGPFKIGHESGTKSEVVLIPWDEIQKEVKADKKAREVKIKAAKLVREAERESEGVSVTRLFDDETVHLDVSKNAVYRLTHEELLTHGIDFSDFKAKEIAISFKGKGVARHIEELDEKGKWTEKSAIEFMGEAPKGSDALYLKANRYQLSIDKKLVVASDVIEPITRKELVFEENTYYSNISPSDDPFHNGTFFTQGYNEKSLTRTFEMSKVGVDTYKMTVYVSASSNVQHHLVISLNGEELTELRPSGREALKITMEVEDTHFQEGSNTLTIRAVGNGEAYDIFTYDKVVVSYDDGVSVESEIPIVTLNDTVKRKTIQLIRSTNYLIISHPLFMGEILNHYVSQRQGEGWQIQVVNVEDIYDEYGYGMATPDAIIEYLKVEQRKGVTHVQLVGAASYDYHDYLGYGSISFIPSIYTTTAGFVSYTPSDTLYVADESGLPQMSIGRWPVRTLEELSAVINKSLDWKNSGQSSAKTALFIADKNDGKLDFKKQIDEIAHTFEVEKQWSNISSVYLDDFIAQNSENISAAVNVARDTIGQALNNGPSITSYNGHSAPSTWSYDGLLRESDISSMQNEGMPTLVLPLACYSTYADSPSVNTMAHQLLAAGEHGAVAVYGATLFSSYAENGMILSKVIEYLFKGETLGEAVLHAKRELGIRYLDTILNGSLLGDVTLKLE